MATTANGHQGSIPMASVSSHRHSAVGLGHAVGGPQVDPPTSATSDGAVERGSQTTHIASIATPSPSG